MSSEINTINNLLQNCLLIGAASFIIFLMISILLARWAVKPVAVAWEQQRQFVSNASHELKTALTVILSNAQMLAENVEDPELRKRMTASMRLNWAILATWTRNAMFPSGTATCIWQKLTRWISLMPR
ncbi:hypothetical protein NE579_12040 [Intestinimonas massiliensis]|uniref:histidine kinase n=2 Tax=Intestinimonas TaxID=1392389 RepID=A0AAW5JQM3_9FIRM|nr:hypothetical protein [Intestinimonas massiliensis (ex Afouda et al. 2020)]